MRDEIEVNGTFFRGEDLERGQRLWMHVHSQWTQEHIVSQIVPGVSCLHRWDPLVPVDGKAEHKTACARCGARGVFRGEKLVEYDARAPHLAHAVLCSAFP